MKTIDELKRLHGLSTPAPWHTESPNRIKGEWDVPIVTADKKDVPREEAKVNGELTIAMRDAMECLLGIAEKAAVFVRKETLTSFEELEAEIVKAQKAGLLDNDLGKYCKTENTKVAEGRI